MSRILIDWQNIGDNIVNFAKTIGLKALEVIAVLILGIVCIRIIVKVLRKIFEKTKMPQVASSFLLNVIKVALYILLMIIICGIVNIPITGFIAVISAAGLALSLALEGSLSNLANGVVIIITRPFNVGDYIHVAGHEGSVVEIKMLHTIINTTDNKRISIPNSTIIGNELTNFSANPTRRVSFDFDIDYASDIEKAKQIILDVMSSCDKVILEPTPFCSLKTLKDSSISLFANCWCQNSDYWNVYYYVMDNVFNEFKRNNINIPFNQMEVRLRTDDVYMPYRQEPLNTRSETTPTPAVEHKENLLEKMISTITNKKDKKNKKEEV